MSKPNQKPKEYIITESDVAKLEYHSPYGWGADIAERCRSHPILTSEQCPHWWFEQANSRWRCKLNAGNREYEDTIRREERIRWTTALNTLIATESKRKTSTDVDMVYSYRVAQIIESLSIDKDISIDNLQLHCNNRIRCSKEGCSKDAVYAFPPEYNGSFQWPSCEDHVTDAENELRKNVSSNITRVRL